MSTIITLTDTAWFNVSFSITDDAPFFNLNLVSIDFQTFLQTGPIYSLSITHPVISNMIIITNFVNIPYVNGTTTYMFNDIIAKVPALLTIQDDKEWSIVLNKSVDNGLNWSTVDNISPLIFTMEINNINYTYNFVIDTTIDSHIVTRQNNTYPTNFSINNINFTSTLDTSIINNYLIKVPADKIIPSFPTMPGIDIIAAGLLNLVTSILRGTSIQITTNLTWATYRFIYIDGIIPNATTFSQNGITWILSKPDTYVIITISADMSAITTTWNNIFIVE